MYKLIDLMTSIEVVRTAIFWDNDWVITNHLAKNPEVGGMPARLANRMVVVVFISISELSLLFSLNRVFHIMYMIISTENQYRSRNCRRIFTPIRTARRVQLTLNTEEIAMISFIFFWFICEITPETALITSLIRITVFIKKIIMNVGASFCHVNSRHPLDVEVFFMTSINHLWNGLAANLIRTEIVPPTTKILLDGLSILILMKRIRIAEAAD
jgi:hypothetical protein